jgi:hypothetical protein
MHRGLRALTVLSLSLGLILTSCHRRTGAVDDAGGRTAADFPELATDVFQPMDGGIALSADEIKGRNTWNLWTGGDEQFWDRMAQKGYGLFDLLKTIDSRRRGSRFREFGLINEPGYRQASKPDRYGLWIDEAAEAEPAGIDAVVYGRPTGIMGFRLFDNPDFKGEAVKKWDAERYYNDADYASQRDLVRPYRVGVACGACHIAFNPTRPPADPENPRWENLASAIGNQYIREGRVFAINVRPGGLLWEMFKTQPPGTSDTSRIATDNINNPNAINPIFELGARLAEGHAEQLAGRNLLLPGTTSTTSVPHVLKDGSDSVGVAGATLRVYVNIGMYSQHLLQVVNPLIGLTAQKPFEVSEAQAHSVYWQATQQKFTNIGKFFTRLKSYRLEDAPGGQTYLTQDAAVMTRGKLVFADQCAGCHSSKRPPADADASAWFREVVLKPDFRDGNFFSDEQRHAITTLQTNAARACGTNAMRGHVWDAFSSETYKQLPSPGDITVWNPFSEKDQTWHVPAGGPGYYRTPSLISVWSSAPLLHNNALGKYNQDPSVAGRMDAFNDAIEKLLWPARRLGKDSIWRTSQEADLQIQGAALPEPLRTLAKSSLDADGYLRIGPIPAGTPVNLLASVDPDTDPVTLLKLIVKINRVLGTVKSRGLDADATRTLMRDELAEDLLRVNKCPDLVEDRGHYYGTTLPDGDKRALIEFLKTL